MNPNDVAPLFISVVLFLTVGAVLIFRGPLGKALARRIDGTAGQGGELTQQVADLEHRLAELEQDRARVAELEERLDFAERLLSQGSRDADRISRGPA
jgi:hypothetical protein